MDFFVHFELDESFNEVIKSRHRDEFSYASFSEGEKQRIDLALLFTWRTIAKMKNSMNTNLLILDEVFDAIDYISFDVKTPSTEANRRASSGICFLISSLAKIGSRYNHCGSSSYISRWYVSK